MTLYHCDKCNKPIGLNEGYVSITHNIEMQEHDTITLKDCINIIDSELIMVLCGKCGNQNGEANIAEAMKLKDKVFHKVQPIDQEKETVKVLVEIDKPSKSENEL